MRGSLVSRWPCCGEIELESGLAGGGFRGWQLKCLIWDVDRQGLERLKVDAAHRIMSMGCAGRFRGYSTRYLALVPEK